MNASNQQDHGRFTTTGEIRFVRHLPGPIVRVWEFLTASDKRGHWLATGPMDLRVGGAVELHFQQRELTPYNETVLEKYQEMCGNGHVMTGTVTRWFRLSMKSVRMRC